MLIGATVCLTDRRSEYLQSVGSGRRSIPKVCGFADSGSLLTEYTLHFENHGS